MRRIKLILAAAATMALMMMVVAVPTALAQDWCYGGCDPSYWYLPTETATTEETSDWECGWAWSFEEEEWVWACWED